MNETHRLFIQISRNRMMEHYLYKLVKSIHSVPVKDLWILEQDHMNSLGGIVLHICEQVKRHIRRYSNLEMVQGDIRDYFPNLDLESDELIVIVKDIFVEWKVLIDRYLNGEYPIERLDMNDVYHMVEHTGYHLGQIVDRTQRISNTSFQFVQNGINEKNLRSLL